VGEITPIKLNRIMCAKCNKPVDKIETWENIASMCSGYAVQCHGEVQKVWLKHIDIVDSKITLEKAFEYQLPHTLEDG